MLSQLISALISLVVAIFFIAGWHMGAVEAVSLSILVGSSVDYCVHLVEGYLLMGKNLPPHIASGVRNGFSPFTAVHRVGLSSLLVKLFLALLVKLFLVVEGNLFFVTPPAKSVENVALVRFLCVGRFSQHQVVTFRLLVCGKK